MKYIMFLTEVAGIQRKVPIIFPDFLVHIEVAKAMKDLIGSSKIASAGDVELDVRSVHGKSTTIGISSKTEDKEIISMYNYFQGMEL